MRIAPAPHLLGIRPGGLAFRALASRHAGVALQLVHHVEAGRVARGGQHGTHAEAVNRRACGKQGRDPVLVQIAAGEEADVGQAAVVEDGAHGPRVRGQVPAVESHRRQPNAPGLEGRRQFDDAVRGQLGVVGVDQQRHVARLRRGKAREGVSLARMGLNVGMRHGAEQRNAEALSRDHRRRAGETGEMAGAGGQQSGLATVGPAQTEVDQQPALCRQHAARGLGGDHGREMNQVDQPRFDELRFADRCLHAQDGLVGEAGRAFAHRPDVAAEAEVAQRLQEGRAEAPAVRQPTQFIRGEAQALEIVEGLFDARDEQEVARLGQAAHEQLEHRPVLHALVEVGLQHRQLVQVGEQGLVVHGTRRSSWSSVVSRAPAASMSATARAPSSSATLTARTASRSSTASKPAASASRTVALTQ